MRILFTIGFLLLASAKASFGQPEIRITSGEWEPFLSNYSHEYGLSNHIVSEAFDNVGVKVVWGFFPWKRAYEIARKGKSWDASSAWWGNEQARRDFLLTEPVSRTSFVFFHLKGTQVDWAEFGDLSGLRIGLTNGYQYGRDFDEALKNHDLDVFHGPRDEQLLVMLLRGRIQVFPNDPIVGMSQIRNNFTPAEQELFTFHPRQFETSTLHLVVSKHMPNGPEMIAKFNQGLEILRSSGRLEEMYRDLDQGKYDKRGEKFQKPTKTGTEDDTAS